MRQYERSGVTIDQCTECRGIFLDRGELEKLFEAEANWNKQHAAPAPTPAAGQAPGGYAPPPPPPGYAQQPGYGQQPGYAQPAYGQPAAHSYPPQPAHGGYHGHYRRKKHKSFLNELFD
jgi:Zn-finger nucleic acid-binding protein